MLQQLSLQELKQMSPLFDEDIHHYLDIEVCVSQRQTYNGTAPVSVERQCVSGKAVVAAEQACVDSWKQVTESVYDLLK